jgi:hypothetical protein
MENSDWYDYVVAGIKYLKTAVNGQSRPNIFTNELTYNLITLSIEKFLVGLSLHFGEMPQHHRLDGLVESVAQLEPMDGELIKNVQAIDNYSDLCSLEVYSRPIPNDMEIKAMLEVAKAVEVFVKQSIERRNAALSKEKRGIEHFKKIFV